MCVTPPDSSFLGLQSRVCAERSDLSCWSPPQASSFHTSGGPTHQNPSEPTRALKPSEPVRTQVNPSEPMRSGQNASEPSRASGTSRMHQEPADPMRTSQNPSEPVENPSERVRTQQIRPHAQLRRPGRPGLQERPRGKVSLHCS